MADAEPHRRLLARATNGLSDRIFIAFDIAASNDTEIQLLTGR